MGEGTKATVKTSQSKTETFPSQAKGTALSVAINSPLDQILFLQRTVGNKAVEGLLKSGVIQAKLTIGQPGDVYEQEADRVAEQVMLMPDPSKARRKGVSEYNKPPSIQRMCTECEEEVHRQPMEEDEELLQTKGASSNTPEINSATESQINSIKGGGQPLSESLRAYFEPRFGQDFSHVRVHTGSQASESANAVNALAYTVGQDVVFGAGQYAPETTTGRQLLAHELSHVLQQRATGSGSGKIGGLDIEPPDTGAEREAEAMAERVVGGEKGVVTPACVSLGLQRKVSSRFAEIRRKLAAKKPGEKEIHDVLLILRPLVDLEPLLGTEFKDTVAAMAREDLVERLLANVGEADKLAMFHTLRRIKNVWPRTVTTTVGKTTVTTTVVGSCSPEQFHQIYLAALLAVQWLNRAITRMDAYLKRPGDATTQDVHTALDLHFHNTTDRVANHVRARLAHIRSDILSLQGFSVECHGIWDKGCDIAMAYASPEQVTFCNSFFYNTSITQAEAVVHEMAHTQVGGTHISDRGYQSERVLRLLSTAEALTNAESYGLFTQQFGTGKLPPMQAPKDKRADCPKDWWDWIEFAIARAQRWNFNARLITNSLKADNVKHWDPRRQQLLGGASESAVDSAKKAYNTLDSKLKSPVKFQCEPLGGGRCDEPGMLNYWYAFWSDFHICPLWRYQATPEDHIEGMLLGLYGYLAGVGDNARRQGYAQLAREWSAGPAPSLMEVLGSTLWKSDRLRITVMPIEPKIPGQDSFTENGTTPHQRISDRLPVYQTESGQAVELPFRCSFDFFVDDENMPRPAPFTPPRLSASLHFRDASAKIQQIIGTTETRPVYQGPGRRLSTSAGGFLEGIFNRNGQLSVKARLEDLDTHITRVYDDRIQIRADRSAEKTAVVPQVEGCTGWEKTPEGFVKQVATYIAVHEINPVIDTRVSLAGCKDPHECTVAFPNGLNMTVIWQPSNSRVLVKWDEQGITQRRVYDYSCAVGRLKLVPYIPRSTTP
jgi:hypothetical protein